MLVPAAASASLLDELLEGEAVRRQAVHDCIVDRGLAARGGTSAQNDASFQKSQAELVTELLGRSGQGDPAAKPGPRPGAGGARASRDLYLLDPSGEVRSATVLGDDRAQPGHVQVEILTHEAGPSGEIQVKREVRSVPRENLFSSLKEAKQSPRGLSPEAFSERAITQFHEESRAAPHRRKLESLQGQLARAEKREEVLRLKAEIKRVEFLLNPAYTPEQEAVIRDFVDGVKPDQYELTAEQKKAFAEAGALVRQEKLSRGREANALDQAFKEASSRVARAWEKRYDIARRGMDQIREQKRWTRFQLSPEGRKRGWYGALSDTDAREVQTLLNRVLQEDPLQLRERLKPEDVRLLWKLGPQLKRALETDQQAQYDPVVATFKPWLEYYSDLQKGRTARVP